MNLTEKKFEPLQSLTQAVLFDISGAVFESDNSISKLDHKRNVFKDSPFFEGMKEVITTMKVGEEIKFPCINVSFFGYESHFDFIVERMDEGDQTKYCWLIYDHSEQYKKLSEMQQERNLKEIETRKLLRDQKKLSDERDAIEQLYHELLRSVS